MNSLKTYSSSARQLVAVLPPAAERRVHPWAPMPVLLAGIFMVVLDFFIVNVALPSIQSDLHTGASAVEWVVAGYALGAAAVLITAGRVGDHVGRRRVFCCGLALFTAASTACGVAPTAGSLVAARVAAGLAAGVMAPSVLSIIGVTYTGEQRLRAISMYGAVLGLAAVSGQLLGGILLQADVLGLGWRAVFLINVPVGIVALVCAPRFVPESRALRVARLDLRGMLLVTIALVAVILPLLQGRQDGWPDWTWASLAFAPLPIALFVRHELTLSRRGEAPLVDPGLFALRSFSAGLLTQLGLWCGQASFFLVLALYLQLGRGLSALHSGLVFTILAVAYLATSIPAPKLTQRFGRSLIGGGALVLAAGHGLLLAAVASVGTGGELIALTPGLILVGAGMGLCITPLTTSVLSGVDVQRAGAVSGVLSTAQQVGNALGVALIGVVFFGALGAGYAVSFQRAEAALALLMVGTAALSRLLPRPRRG